MIAAFHVCFVALICSVRKGGVMGEHRLTLKNSILPVIALLSSLTASLAVFAQDAAIVRKAKDATAYIEPAAGGSATAFCIDAAGYFATSYHAIKGVGNGKLRLVLNPTEPNQHVVEAIVIRENVPEDIALLKADYPEPLTALELGAAGSLTETNVLTTFGFPFGKAMIPTGRIAYPAITISIGRITSFRREQGVLNAILVDAPANPGNSGGPVVDDRGFVVGIMQGSALGLPLSTVIPVERLKTLLLKPVISFVPQTVPFEKRYDQQKFIAELQTLNTSETTGYQVELKLTGNSGSRLIRLMPHSGKYAGTARLIEPSPGPAKLRVMATYANGSLAGEIADREVKVGGKAMKLSGIARIAREGTPEVMLVTGETTAGKVEGMEGISINVGGVRSVLGIATARKIEIQRISPPERHVAYTLVVRKATEIVGELNGTITLTGAPVGSDQTIAPPVFGISPIAAAQTSIRLPAPSENTIVAGGGRYLVFEMRRLRQLAVFDVNAARITNFIPLPSDKVKIAAGMDSLVVLALDKNQLQRWSLKSMEKELTVSLDVSNANAVAMGYSSAGPLLLLTSKGPVFYDIGTLKPLEIKDPSGDILAPGDRWPAKGIEVSASADGTAFAAWAPTVMPTGLRLIILDGTIASSYYDHADAGALLPANDGSMLFTSTGILSPNLKPISKEIFGGIQFAPSMSPAYFIGLKSEEYRTALRGKSNKIPSLNVYTSGDRRLLITLPDFPELAPPGDGFPRSIGIDKRVFLIPQANLLVTLPEAQDELFLRRVNLLTELEKSGVDYLFVAGLPARVTQKGQLYQYAIDVKSKRGGVIYKLETGPSGMKVNAAGVLSWSVPKTADPQASVIVSIRDASGQEIYHSFTLVVR
jgi:serine protease Do